MLKLSDTQLVILSNACQREHRLVLPLPERLRGGAAAKVVGSLIARHVIEEVEAGPGDPVWREADDGHRLTLIATDAAFEALGFEPAEAADGAAVSMEPAAAAQAGTGGREAARGTDEAPGAEAAPTPATGARGRKSQPDSKQAKLVAMLQRPEGASLDEIVTATGWQKHTVRGAIAGALKKKLGLAITSEKVEGRGRVYRIAAEG